MKTERPDIDYLGDIRRFRDALLQSDIGNQIAKIIWFGSTLKKTAHEASDVDLLILTTDGERVPETIADVLLDFQMTARSPLEIVTSNIDDLYPVIDYFLKDVLTYGQAVYSMPEENLKLAAARHYLSLPNLIFESAVWVLPASVDRRKKNQSKFHPSAAARSRAKFTSSRDMFLISIACIPSTSGRG